MKEAEKSHKLHEASYGDVNTENEYELYKNWYDSNTTDVWRHLRMLEVLHPFFDCNPSATWLTVGDGRFGTAASYINRHGGKVTASDIDIRLLKIAKERGLIPDYVYANAEHLPFDENSWDYAFCKESYHHFPRPYLAVYEMLRVSRKAVMFTEPADWMPNPIPLRFLRWGKNVLRRLTGKTIPHHDEGNYEDIGNYVYSISVREFEKIALGLGLRYIAYKKFHDVFIQGVQHETLSDEAPILKKIKSELRKNSFLTRLGLSGKSQIQIVIFKTDPTKHEIEKFTQRDFKFVHLPKNPYV